MVGYHQIRFCGEGLLRYDIDGVNRKEDAPHLGGPRAQDQTYPVPIGSATGRIPLLHPVHYFTGG